MILSVNTVSDHYNLNSLYYIVLNMFGPITLGILGDPVVNRPKQTVVFKMFYVRPPLGLGSICYVLYFCLVFYVFLNPLTYALFTHIL